MLICHLQDVNLSSYPDLNRLDSYICGSVKSETNQWPHKYQRLIKCYHGECVVQHELEPPDPDMQSLLKLHHLHSLCVQFVRRMFNLDSS